MKKQWNVFWFLILLGCSFQMMKAQQPWYLSGNTVSANHQDFLGTLNGYPLDFRVMNQWAGTIDTNGRTFIGFLAGNATALGTNSGFGAGVLSNANATAQSNTGMGKMSLNANTTGSANSAFGAYS
jgi:hypothetical protein